MTPVLPATAIPVLPLSPSDQIISGGWRAEQAHYMASLCKYGIQANIAPANPVAAAISGFALHPVTKATGRSFWADVAFGNSDQFIVSSQTVADTYPLLAALEDIRLDVVRQGAAVAALGKQFTHLAEEVHELRGGSHQSDTITEPRPSPDTIEHGLTSLASQGSDETQAVGWLNAAADVGYVSDRAIAVAEESLISPNALVRSAAARILAISETERSKNLLCKAAKTETNKLARAIMESALRALSAE